MIGADVQALAWPFGGKRCQDHQRRAHATDQRRCVAALEFRQSGYETKFGQHHHCDHRCEPDGSQNGEELRPSGAPLVGDCRLVSEFRIDGEGLFIACAGAACDFGLVESPGGFKAREVTIAGLPLPALQQGFLAGNDQLANR
jgi:hypothetical protein